MVVVGHSFGSIMSDLILGTTPGIADGFVATGWTNGYEPNLPHFEDVFNAIDQPPNTVPYITLPSKLGRVFLFWFALSCGYLKATLSSVRTVL